LDAEDRYLFWNRRYAELHSESPHLRPGLPFRRIVEIGVEAGAYPEARGREREWIEARMARHALPQSSEEQQLPNGRWIRIEERRTPDGGSQSVAVDITELKRALHEAQAADRAKSEFLANMSHELRTPLNGVLGLADVLAMTSLDDAQRDIVETIRGSADDLKRLLSDVLDIARIEAGRVEIVDRRFDLVEAVRAAVALARPAAAEKGLRLDLGFDEFAGGVVEGDETRVKQVLANLLGNAVKFTDAGAVTLTVRTLNDGGRLFEVRDTGIGFDPADAERLFARFSQADASDTRRHGGAGLGLAISRDLAELMGGTLKASSEAGEGSVFSLVLPFRGAGSTALAA